MALKIDDLRQIFRTSSFWAETYVEKIHNPSICKTEKITCFEYTVSTLNEAHQIIDEQPIESD